jgi:hypothetical protein
MELEPHDAEAVATARKSSPYASFGTWAHFYLQDALRCEFEGGRDAHVPDAETKASAIELFSGDADACEAAIRQCATIAAKNMPIPADGQLWRAEASCSGRVLSGHLDFLSQDCKIVVDLKTTSRKPPHGQAKAEHIAQVAGAYPYLVNERFGIMPDTAVILYVGTDGTWVLPVVIDLRTPERQDYIRQIGEYATFLRSKPFMTVTMPVLGPHCSDMWCPYRAICKDRISPPQSEFSDHGLPPVPNMRVVGI